MSELPQPTESNRPSEPARHPVKQGLPSEDSAPPLDEAGLPALAESLDLVRRFQDGSQEALDSLFRRYHDRLLRIIRAQMSPKLRRLTEPEDILQDTLLTATERAPLTLFDSHAGILRWLSQIARHRLLDRVQYFGAKRRDPGREVNAVDDSQDDRGLLEPKAPSLDSPSQVVQRAELEEIVDRCVNEVEPAEYREALLQRNYYGASWEEVAEALGRETSGAAREVYRRAKIKLGLRLGPLLRASEKD